MISRLGANSRRCLKERRDNNMAKKTRKFNGKVYTRVFASQSKYNADKRAAGERRNHKFVRVTKVRETGTKYKTFKYTVWIRSDPNW